MFGGQSGTQAFQNQTMSVSGQLIQGTPDGLPLPEAMELELQVINISDVEVLSRHQTVSTADGSFVFADVPRYIQDDVIYTVVARYDGVEQFSDSYTAESASFIEMPIYETTSSLDDVSIAEGNFLITFLDLPAEVATNTPLRQTEISILMELNLVNQGDHIVYQHAPEGDIPSHSIGIELPVGAYNIAQQDPLNPRFSIEGGIIPVIYDQIPIPPGKVHRIVISFFTDYNNGAVIDQVFPVPASGLQILIPEETVQISSDHFSRQADVLASENEERYQVYEQIGTLGRNESLIFTIEGRPSRTINTAQADTSSAQQRDEEETEESSGINLVLVVGISLGLFGLLIGIIIWQRKRATLADF
jgi:hypothetical protein